jgi:phosphatidylserine/phosphatidylglycerophosphate/cardiolipin synthase-like enzyme
MKRLLISLITALSAFGMISAFLAPPAAAAPWVPREGVIFNNPKGAQASEYRIILQIVRAVERAPRGSTISMAMYLFNQQSIAWRLYAAHRRGVNVQIIIDDGENSPQIRYLKSRLGTNKRARSFVFACRRSCMSNIAGSVVHSKFFAFSKTGGRNWVTMISSANPHTVNVEDSWNNLHTIVNRRPIYNAVRNYFVHMKADINRSNYYRAMSSGKYSLYFFPRAARAGVNTSNILDALNRVSCRGPISRGYGSGGRTVIRVAMWGWTTARMDVAKKLWSLHNAGCKVDATINHGRISRGILSQLLKKSARYGQIRLFDAWRDKNRNDYAELYVHHKAFIINGRWNGRPNAKVVYTGSQNLTSTGIRVNDDMILRVMDAGTYNAYSSNFSYLQRWAKRLTKMPPRIVLRSSPHADRRAAFSPLQVNAADGLTAAEARVLDAAQDAVIESSLDR